MAAINESIKGIWKEWKRLYDTSTDPGTKKISLENLRALDISDDGQKNNSVDKSLNIWDIQDPGAGQGSGSGSGTGGGGSGSGAATKTEFDKWWNQLPDDVKTKVKEKFAGSDGVFSEEEMGAVNSYLKAKAGTDGAVAADEIETIRKELVDTPTPNVAIEFDKWFKQVPDDVKTQLKEKFAGPDGVFSLEEMGAVNNYLKSKAGTDGTISADEIETIRKELVDSPKPDVAIEFDKWFKQVPDDVKTKLKEKFAGPDGVFSLEEMGAVNNYLKSKAGTDGTISADEVETIRKELVDTPKPEIAVEFDKWFKQLPDDVRKALGDKFAGMDSSLSVEEMTKLVEYLKTKTGTDGVVTPAEIETLRKELGITA